MKKTAILMVVCLMAGQHAFAGDESSGKKGGGTIEKIGKEAGHGIQRGADAAGRGIKRGGRAAGHGLTTAGNWLERKLDKHGGKKEEK